MKKSFYFILLAVVLLSFTGCKVEDSNIGCDRAVTGILNGWQQGVMDMNTLFLESVFNFNAWYSAPDSLRNSIEDKYFSYLKIRQVGDNAWAIMRGQNRELLVETNGATLSSSANWVVTLYDNGPCYGAYGYIDESFTSKDLKIEIQTIQPNTWSITVNPKENRSADSYNTFEPYAQLTMSFINTTEDGAVPATLKTPYTLTGQGRFKFRNKDFRKEETSLSTESNFTCLDFHIDETLVNDALYQIPAYSQGAVTLRAFNAAGTDRMVKASFQKNGEEYYIDLDSGISGHDRLTVAVVR